MRLLVFALCATLAMAGQATPLQTAPAGNDPSLDPKACAARGGTIERRGMLDREMCVVRFKDAGKTCSGKADCEGKCFASSDIGWRKHPVGTRAKGKCQHENSEFGCLARVERGRIASLFLCTD